MEIRRVNSKKYCSELNQGFELENCTMDIMGPLICCVCLCLPRYPVHPELCPHMMCMDCMSKLPNDVTRLGTYKKCPQCRQQFYADMAVPLERFDPILKRLYTLITVKCQYNCGESGGTVEMREHELTQCKLRPVLCRYKNCSEETQANNIKEHEEKCKSAKIYCKKCHLPKLKLVENHDCMKALMEAVKKLGTLVPFKDMLADYLPGKGGEPVKFSEGLYDYAVHNASRKGYENNSTTYNEVTSQGRDEVDNNSSEESDPDEDLHVPAELTSEDLATFFRAGLHFELNHPTSRTASMTTSHTTGSTTATTTTASAASNVEHSSA